MNNLRNSALIFALILSACARPTPEVSKGTEADKTETISSPSLPTYDAPVEQRERDPADNYKTLLMGSVDNWEGSRFIYAMDKDELYNDIRPELCGLLDDPQFTLTDIEIALVELYRRSGLSEIAAERVSTSFIEVTTKYGECGS